MYFLSFWFEFTRFALYILRDRKKESAHAYAVIEELEKAYNGKFDDATRKKIAGSHGVYNPLVIDAFCRLHGRLSTPVERKRLIYYFVCSSLLDNFFDRKELSLEAIGNICFKPEEYIPASFDEKVFLHCHRSLLEGIPSKQDYLAVLHAEVNAQERSMQQFKKDISNEDLASIMKSKGGNAVLLCRYYLDYPASGIEDSSWYQLGVIIQLNNDLYDIYKDINDGIETLATRCRNAFEMEAFAEKEISLLRQLIADLPFTKDEKQRFNISAAGVCASTRVGIDRLKRLQGDAPELPDLAQLERKQLIIDMERPSNIVRWLSYAYHYAR